MLKVAGDDIVGGGVSAGPGAGVGVSQDAPALSAPEMQIGGPRE